MIGSHFGVWSSCFDREEIVRALRRGISRCSCEFGFGAEAGLVAACREGGEALGLGEHGFQTLMRKGPL